MAVFSQRFSHTPHSIRNLRVTRHKSAQRISPVKTNMSSISGTSGMGDSMRLVEPEQGNLSFNEQSATQDEVEDAGLPQLRRQPSQQPLIEFPIVDDSDEGDEDDDEWSDSDATLSESGEVDWLNQYGGWYFNLFSWRYELKYWFVRPDPGTSCNPAAAALNEPVSLLTKYRYQRLQGESAYFETSVSNPSIDLFQEGQVRRGSPLKKVRNVDDQRLRWA